MITNLVKIRENIDLETQLVGLGEQIRRGNLVAFPTETVYGLGANGLDKDAVKSIYVAKGRPNDNPVILHVENRDDVDRLVDRINDIEAALMEKFWPGPLTIVFQKSDLVPSEVAGGGRTVAIRMPVHPVARALIKVAGVPIAAPSANLSGRPSPCTAKAVLEDMNGRIAAVIDGGACSVGLESTVVGCQENKIVIYRPGMITQSMLSEIAPTELDESIITGIGVPKSPGMKYKHYSPRIPVVLNIGSALAVERTFSEEYSSRKGYLVSAETASFLPQNRSIVVWGKRSDTAGLAACMYEALLYLEKQDIDLIEVEGVLDEDLGMAIMNRLKKASGYHIRKLL